jgi:hypothetical protein
MQVNEVVLIPLVKLRPNPDNPKKPMGARYLRGLKASLAKYGFAGVLQVAGNADGSFVVLDGNTRLAELDAAGIEQAWCQPVPACCEGVEGWQDARKAFVLAHDRNRKVFDEDAVLTQLKELAAHTTDLAGLETLTASENLRRLVEESKATTARAATASKQTLGRMAEQGSLVLYGPAEDVTAIKELLKRVRGRLSPVLKMRRVLEQAEAHEDLTAEEFLLALTSAIHRVQTARAGSSGERRV